MNCQSCNQEIDYRFLSNCTQCGCAVETTGLPHTPAIPIHSTQKSKPWVRNMMNLAYVFLSSGVGMISGAVVVYLGAALIYCAVYSGVNENPSVACARGQAIGFMSILVGAFLGTMGGCAFGVKRPLCKAPSH